ncbi:MAG: peptide chain release factor N(5)-glutamine methyltransferase [Deltaproteobacteria bacterium]|nr:peptide chain release factor N(5)-glutamine methyltransferase [Deltaproteobacteria bacterium]MBW2070099.1 peptide chain release factor N(5)-glutamine methyltransferase [Deltaproteobacteria bacterium]
MPEAPWTILKLLRWTTAYFDERGVAEPRASAELLLAHVLSLDRLSLYLNYDRPLLPAELSEFKKCIKRRLRGEPVQYITGTQEFWSMLLHVSPDVLIPRPETEVLVQTALDHLHSTWPQESTFSILDVGTGSGAVAISLARELSKARIVALDVSFNALQLARKNSLHQGVSGRLLLVCSDLLTSINKETAKFHLVVSNPPYIRSEELPLLPREISAHEPRSALDGGPDGLAVIRRIVAQAAEVLLPRGALAVEIGADQAEGALQLVSADCRYNKVRVDKDYSGMDRILLAQVA